MVLLNKYKKGDQYWGDQIWGFFYSKDKWAHLNLKRYKELFFSHLKVLTSIVLIATGFNVELLKTHPADVKEYLYLIFFLLKKVDRESTANVHRWVHVKFFPFLACQNILAAGLVFHWNGNT